MALFDYRCKTCGVVFEEDHPVGKAPKETKCKECGETAKRAYTTCNFSMEGPTSNMKFNKEMTERNRKAEERMWKNRDRLPKLVDQG